MSETIPHDSLYRIAPSATPLVTALSKSSDPTDAGPAQRFTRAFDISSAPDDHRLKAIKLIELRRDLEAAILSDIPAAEESESKGARLGGLISRATLRDDFTMRLFSTSPIESMIEDMGKRAKADLLVIMSLSRKARLDELVTVAPHIGDPVTSSVPIIGGHDLVRVGDVCAQCVPHPSIRDDVILVIDPSGIELVEVSPVTVEELAKTGDYDTYMLHTSFALRVAQDRDVIGVITKVE